MIRKDIARIQAAPPAWRGGGRLEVWGATMGPESCPRCGATIDEASGPGCPSCTSASVASGAAEATIDSTMGDETRALLRGMVPGERPLVFGPSAGGSIGRYRIAGEIGRGGMGVVLRARDPVLGRDVAVKVLRDERAGGDRSRRFVEEAQIAGQLQHPGIVPVYEFGTSADVRPYLAMRLVEGLTLSALLAGRADRDAELPRFLGIFLAASQAVAYAHSRGVIHRDLKPGNVMVGNFGEVLVMDWGLAKVVGAGDAGGASEPDGPTVAPVSTARVESGDELSRSGAVLGTPAYMAPEQARGEVDRLGPACDVFALGAILCEILTGRPPYEGPSASDAVEQARQGATGEALARLDHSGADAELVAIARDCLAASAGDRPADASAVAARVVAYQDGVRDRLRAAELAAAAEAARAEEATRTAAIAEEHARAERRARRFQAGLAAAMLGLTLLGGFGSLYIAREQSARTAVLAGMVAEAFALRDQAATRPQDPSGWGKARTAVRQAEAAAGGDGRTLQSLASLLDEINRGDAAAGRDRAFLERLAEIRSGLAHDQQGPSADDAYARAFREAGLDVGHHPTERVASAILGRPAPVALEIVSALEHWRSFTDRSASSGERPKRLDPILRLVDADPWRARVRDAREVADPARRAGALAALADSPEAASQAAMGLLMLAAALEHAGERARAEAVLRAAHRTTPDDLWLNLELAQVLARSNRKEESTRFYTAARAIRPGVGHQLAHALQDSGKVAEAVEVFRDMARLRPDDGEHLACLGVLLFLEGRRDEARAPLEAGVALLRRRREHHPDDPFTIDLLGTSLNTLNRHAEAEEAFRAAIRLVPDDARLYNRLGLVLRGQRKDEEAIAAYRKAIELRPGLAYVHSNLGNALRDDGRLEEALRCYERALQLEPSRVSAQNSHADLLRRLGRTREAIEAYRRIVRQSPRNVSAYVRLNELLLRSGNYLGAIAALKERVAIRPDDPDAYVDLGKTYTASRQYPEAAEAFRKALKLRPNHVDALYHLGRAQRLNFEFDAALSSFNKAAMVGPVDGALRQALNMEIRDVGRICDLLARLPEILQGDATAFRSNEERVNLARTCGDLRRFGAAVRLWEDAFRVDPQALDRRDPAARVLAARAACQVAEGKDVDNPAPDEAARARYRARALEWLRGELAYQARRASEHPSFELPDEIMPRLLTDARLASVREPRALAALPPAERAAWESFWADARSLIDAEK